MGFDIDVPALPPVGGGSLPPATIPETIKDVLNSLDIKYDTAGPNPWLRPINCGEIECASDTPCEQYLFAWVDEYDVARAFCKLSVTGKDGWIVITRLTAARIDVYRNKTLAHTFPRNLYPTRAAFEGTMIRPFV